MGRTACTESQCLYKGALYLTVELYLYSPYGPYGLYSLSACAGVTFTLHGVVFEEVLNLLRCCTVQTCKQLLAFWET